MKNPIRVSAAAATALAVSAATLVAAGTAAAAASVTGSVTVADPSGDVQFDHTMPVSEETKTHADITSVDVVAYPEIVEVTVTATKVPDGSTHGVWYSIDLHAEGAVDGADSVYTSVDTGYVWPSDGEEDECGTITTDPAASKVRMTVPRDCFPDSTALVGVEVHTAAYPMGVALHDATDVLISQISVPLSPMGEHETTGPKKPGKKGKATKPGKKAKKNPAKSGKSKFPKPGKKPKKATKPGKKTKGKA